MEYGTPLKRPPISKDVYPGSWSALHNKSPFIISGVELVLEHMVKKLGYDIPSDIKLQLFSAGAQIVSGVNIYLEFRVMGSQTWDVQANVTESAVLHHPNGDEGHGGNSGHHAIAITGLYITGKKILK